MANFVIIEKDERLVREITGLIGELDEENRVRAFPTIHDFEENYFTDPSMGVKSLREHPKLSSYSEDQFKWLITHGVNWQKKPVGNAHVRIDVFFEGWNIVKTEPVINQFMGQKITLKPAMKFDPLPWIPAEFQNIWSDALKKFESGDDVEVVVPIRLTEADTPWMFKFHLHLDGMEIHIDALEISAMFKTLIEKEKATDEAADEANPIFAVIDMVLFQYDHSDNKIAAWAKDTLLKLKKGNFCPEGNLTRLVAMKWENDHHDISQYFSPYIDEVLYFPLDRLLFLQKIDSLMNLPKNPKPRFLFEQDVKLDIEISKKTHIHEINDLGFAISNPIPMKTGLMGHFYFSLPGSKEILKVHGRSYESKKNPTEPGSFLVYFDFFGIDKNTLSAVRRYLKDNRQYRPIINQDAKMFEFNPDDMFLNDEQKRRRNIIIIDPDHDRVQTIKDIIKQDFGQTVLYHEPSYLSFLYKYLKSADSTLAQCPLLENKDVAGGSFSFEISRETGTITHEAPKKKEGDPVSLPVILDWAPEHLFAAGDHWKKLLASKKEEEILAELMKSLNTGKRIRSTLRIKLQNGDARLSSLELHGLPSGAVNLTFSPPTVDEVNVALAPQDLTRIDMIFIAANSVSQEAVIWHQALIAELKGKNLIKEDNVPIVLLESDSTLTQVPKHLVQGEFYSYLKAPVDRRLLACTIAKATDNPFSIYKTANLGWAPTKATAYLARAAHLKKISEFGCKLHMPQKLSPGTILYFHGSFFDQAKAEPVSGRVYHVEEDASEKSTYHCSFFYFGITDAFLKFTRSWIRENYAHQKQKEGG